MIITHTYKAIFNIINISLMIKKALPYSYNWYIHEHNALPTYL